MQSPSTLHALSNVVLLVPAGEPGRHSSVTCAGSPGHGVAPCTQTGPVSVVQHRPTPQPRPTHVVDKQGVAPHNVGPPPSTVASPSGALPSGACPASEAPPPDPPDPLDAPPEPAAPPAPATLPDPAAPPEPTATPDPAAPSACDVAPE